MIVLRRYLLLLVTACVLMLVGCDSSTEPPALEVGDLMGGEAEAGYARAIEPRVFHFPADHASHPEFRNEWWYVTGNVSSDDGHEFGYQFTLFRIALSPHDVDRPSAWSSRHVWMGHMALTDITGEQYYYAQRFARGAVGLAGFQQQPFKVWLEDWTLEGAEAGHFPWNIYVKHNNFELALQLQPAKNIILQGDKGLSQKSAKKGNASYYYSITDLQSVGSIRVAGEQYKVSGKSWLDREWSTSALGKDQKGWDWFSLHFDKGVELMYYQMRKKSGDVDPLSSGTLVKPDGSAVHLASSDIELTPLDYWVSEQGRRYPVAWRMTFAKVNKSWRIEARLDNQEMSAGVQYWEGAVQVIDEDTGGKVGKGYLEMTGY